MTPSLERTAALLEDRAVMERLLHDAANYAWEHHGPASSRAFFDRVKVALANYDALLAEAARLRALPEGKPILWQLVEGQHLDGERVFFTREDAERWRDKLSMKPGGPYRVVGLAVVEETK